MNPISYNMLSPLGFRVVSKRLPELQYWAQKAMIPAVSVPVIKQPTPFIDIPISGRKIVYGDLVVEFKVDELLGNYQEIYDWMVQQAFPKEDNDSYDYADTNTELILMILDSNERPKREITYKGAFPIGMSALYFSSTEPDVQYLACAVTFAYERFDIKPVE